MWWAPAETLRFRGADAFFRLEREEVPGGGGQRLTFDATPETP